MNHFDAIVIGGGPAGSTTAGFLTKMGRRVLILERERFPRHHIGESMIASTFDVLEEIGLEEKIQAMGFPVKSGGCFIWGESTDPWCIRFDEIPGRATSFQVKRDVFDTILLDHAAELGAEVRQEARVTDVLVDGATMTGVRFDHDGKSHEASAPYVVDASGLNAVVANKVSHREAAEGLKNMALYGYWTGAHPSPAQLGGDLGSSDRNNIIIKMLDTGWLWFIPLGFDDLVSVGYVTQRDRLPTGEGVKGLEAHYRDRIRASSEFDYLLSHSEYTGDFHTVKDWSYRSLRMAGSGYFAVGDAACFVDPILSSGVYLGVLFAKLCATAVNTCLSEPEREPLVDEWYEGLYNDAYTDYMEMAQLWYHGDRKVTSWMRHAQDNLASEAASEYTQTDRSSFIGLATGNAHTHPNYVLLRQLKSFPLPLYLRKDPRSGFHRQAHSALLAHADSERLNLEVLPLKDGAKTGLASPRARREAVGDLVRPQARLVDKLDPSPDREPPDHDTPVALSSSTRLSLEALGDRVEMVLNTDSGQRRLLSAAEQALLARTANSVTVHELATDGTGEAQHDFVEELVEARVLVDREHDT